LYILDIKDLQSKGFEVLPIVCDERKGLLQSFGSIPVRMCQFDQLAIILRRITKNLKILASNELKEFVAMLKIIDKESFEGGL
jgi:hypothetical protein